MPPKKKAKPHKPPVKGGLSAREVAKFIARALISGLIGHAAGQVQSNYNLSQINSGFTLPEGEVPYQAIQPYTEGSGRGKKR